MMTAHAGRLAVLSLMLLCTGQLGAQQYPTRSIRYIVPYPPGGGQDLVARQLARKLTEVLGRQVVIDNRPGGGAVTGTLVAASSPSDGYTIFMGSTTTHAMNPNLYDKLAYDPIKDFMPVTQIADSMLLLVVHPSLPVKSLKDLIALAKTRPGQLNFGSSGNATPAQLGGLMMNRAAKIDMVHVPYKGSGPALTALLSGETQLMFGSMGSALPFAKSGRLKPLAVTGARRSSAIPEMPTVAEQGYPGFLATTWYGVLVPAGTPVPIIEKLHATIVRVLQDPQFKETLANDGAEVVASTPAEFMAHIKSELSRYRPIIKESGMRPD